MAPADGYGQHDFPIDKIASKMRKPDGLFIIEHHQLPDILHPLKLRNFTGIGSSMEARLHAVGIRTVEGQCDATKPELHKAWGGVLGARYGRKVIYYGRVQESRDEAPMRIAFTHIPDAGLEQD
ncbi:MAG: hypothetical protein WCK77_02625 [Verrucomicrobiota bacterium]